MKWYLISKYIYNSNSEVIISTRYYFTKLLNKYGYKDTIKVAEEHVYHNNDIKYINKLRRSLTNIDYLIPASNYLKDDYKEITQYTANRISGILMLYLASDYKRINDIVNKYNIKNESINNIIPEVEGYINK